MTVLLKSINSNRSNSHLSTKAASFSFLASAAPFQSSSSALYPCPSVMTHL